MAELSPEDAGARIQVLLDELAGSSDPDVPERVAELVQCVLRLHAAGLGELVARISPEVLVDAAADERVASLLVLHDLHPVPLAERASAALGRLQSVLGPVADDVQLTEVDVEGVAHVRLGQAAGGAATMLALSLRQGLLDAVPDLADVRLDLPPAGPAFVPLLPTRHLDTEAQP